MVFNNIATAYYNVRAKFGNLRTPESVEWALNMILQPEDTALREIRNRTVQLDDVPSIEVSQQQGRLLTQLVRMHHSSRVLEIGTLLGYSTLCLARGIGYSGSVTTIEADPDFAKYAQQNFDVFHEDSRSDSVKIELINSDAIFAMSRLENEIACRQRCRYDFIFIDADNDRNLHYLQCADRLGTNDVVVVVDNVIRDGRVLDPERPEKMDFLVQVGKSDEWDASVIQTVGDKPWDGFMVLTRKPLNRLEPPPL